MIAIGSDHGGYSLKQVIMKHLDERGLEYHDFGTYNEESCDYPDYGEAVARAVASGEYERGIIICGTGIGISISANKVHGIRAALIDLDGTMVSHKTALPTEEVAAFIRRLEDNGIHVVVFSNNNANRVGTFCEPLGVDFISRAHKPFARAYAQAVERLGLPIDQIAVIGDQIYTDVFGGNRAGALTCYVETLDRRFFWINVRYQLERGFIARGRRRMEARRHD